MTELTSHLSKRILGSVKPTRPESLVLEAWSQGFVVGALIVMSAITIANMRKHVLLHKLILLELFLGMWHATFIFWDEPAYGWYLSATAIALYTSISLHNVIAWMKTKPFLSRRWSQFYIGTVILTQPYWVIETYANFTYFNNIAPTNTWFHKTRPFEALFRDPWWIFTTLNLFFVISTRYNLSIATIVKVSPRFGVLLTAMLLSIAFLITDICSVTGVFHTALPDGLNPFWKLAFVFKCLVDSIVLDDFKTALDRLMLYKLRKERIENSYLDDSQHEDSASRRAHSQGNDVETIEFAEDDDYYLDSATADQKVGVHGPIHPGPTRPPMVARATTTTTPMTIHHGQKAMPKDVKHFDDISLPDLEHFAVTHTWKGW